MASGKAVVQVLRGFKFKVHFINLACYRCNFFMFWLLMLILEQAQPYTRVLHTAAVVAG